MDYIVDVYHGCCLKNPEIYIEDQYIGMNGYRRWQIETAI